MYFYFKGSDDFFIIFFFAPKCLWRKYFDATNEKPRICCVNKNTRRSLVTHNFYLFTLNVDFSVTQENCKSCHQDIFYYKRHFVFTPRKKSPKLITGLFSFRIGKGVPDRGSGMNEWMRIWRWVFLKAILKVGVICIVVVVLGSWSSWSRKNLGSMVIIFAKFCLESRILETTSTNQHVISLVSKSRNHLFFSFS